MRTAAVLRAGWHSAIAAVIAMPVLAQSNVRKDDDGHPLVLAVQARGVSKIDRRTLINGLATKATKCRSILYAPLCLLSRSPTFAARRYLDAVELRRDVLRIRLFYWRRGYRDTQVSSQVHRSRGGVRVVFDIKENAPTIVESLEIQQTDSVLPATVISRAVQLRAREPLDLVAMDSSMVLLRNALWDRGHADALVVLDTSAVSNERNAGAVKLVLTAGARTIVDSIDIAGTKTVSRRTIHRLLRFAEGGLYRRSDVLESQRTLYLSGLFSEVDIGALPTRDSAKTVALRVADAQLRRLDLVTGLTTADFLQAEAVFTRYNFFGSARRLTLRGTISNLLARSLNGSGIFYDVTNGATGRDRDMFLRPAWAASIDFTQPWLLSPNNQLGASIFTHRRVVPGVVTDIGAGATIGLTRDLGLRSTTTFGYTYEASRLEASDVYFCVSIGLCVPSAIAVIADRHPLSPVSVVTQIDRTNDPFNPNQGVRIRLDVEHASGLTASEYRYNRAALSASSYRRVSKQSVLAGRIRLGWVGALAGTNRALGIFDDTSSLVIHPRKLFYAGGSQSVRGYGENQLGPRVLTVDPARLLDTALVAHCTAEQLQDGSCDPNLAGVAARAFQPHPVGGTSLVEASVEYRFPLALAEGLKAAVFIDGAIVGTSRYSGLVGTSAAITPGFGIRFDTRAGPVRLDLGIRPRVVDELPVITQITNTDGSFHLVTLATRRRFDEAETTGGSLRQILSRLTMHLAIGPAF